MLFSTLLVFLSPLVHCLQLVHGKVCSITRAPVGPELCRTLCSHTAGVKQCRYHISQMKCEVAGDEQKTGSNVMLLTQIQAGSVDSAIIHGDCKKFSRTVINGRQNVVCISQCYKTHGKKKSLVCPADRVKSLFKAVTDGKLSKVKKLLSKGVVDVNCRDELGRTAVMAAAVNKQEQILDLLLKHKCDLSAVDLVNENVLHYACFGGKMTIIGKLLNAYTFDIECRGQTGKTPLMITVHSGHISAFSILHRKGADVNTVDDDNNTILHLACQSGEIPYQMVMVVLPYKKTIGINPRDKDGRTPLMAAVETGTKKVVQLLKLNGAAINLTDNMNNNVLHLACRGGNIEVVKYILSLHVCGLESREEIGRTPLMLAVEQGHIKVVNFLLENYKTNITTDNDGMTVFHIACKAGYEDLVKYMVTVKELRDAESMENKAGETPRNVAVKNGHHGIASFLRSWEG